ncbi:MAG: DivIVA domain-containing protein [Acidimicrobiales bacterium]|jgi:cell division initiation protein
MDSTDSAYSALDAIDTVAFKIGVRGYNVDEVDDFLEKLSGEVHQLKELVSQQRQQLRQAGERINQLDARGGSDAPASVPASAPAPAPAPRHISVSGAEQVTAMIVMAQQFIEQAQSEAEAKAREMTTSAQERAREIVAEARSRAEDEVNRLNGLKQRLSEDVETLTRQLDTERKRLGAALAEFSRWIESSLQVGGARSTAAPEPAPRPIKPPPAPAPSTESVGQVLNFETPSHDDRL